MMQADSGTAFGQVRVLVTSGGVHTPETWAGETARAIISIDPNMAETRYLEAVELRKFLTRLLVDVFHAVRPTSSSDNLKRIAAQVRSALIVRAQGSPWQMNFEALSDMIELAIWRNLHTAANIALQTE